MRILVTGSTGFIGTELVKNLLLQGYAVTTAQRTLKKSGVWTKCDQVKIDLSDSRADWSSAFKKVDVVIHLAARAHVINETAIEPLVEFRKINVDSTVRVAEAALKAGVKKFIFLSSIGVNGNSTVVPFKASDLPFPIEDYAISKLEAELSLKSILSKTAMDLIIIRPPLVYGPGAPGNFSRLVKLAKMKIPIPFSKVANKRSLVGIDNLIDLILTCVRYPNPINETFLVSDGRDLSTADLIKKIASVFNKKIYLVPLPIGLIRFIGALTGKQRLVDKVFGSLQVDIEHTKTVLGWSPQYSVEHQLSKLKDFSQTNE